MIVAAKRPLPMEVVRRLRGAAGRRLEPDIPEGNGDYQDYANDDRPDDATAYISLVFIGIVLFILVVGCLIRMCRPPRRRPHINLSSEQRRKKANAARGQSPAPRTPRTGETTPLRGPPATPPK